MTDRSPTNPYGFEERKLDRELLQRNIELYSAHQSDTRQRVDTLAKAMFLLSGGALTVAIGIFLREEAPTLSPHQALVLRVALWSLFGTMAGFATIIGVMIAQAYVVGWTWGRRLRDRKEDDSKTKWLLASEVFNWAIGILAFFSFLTGLGALAWLASSLVRS